MGYLFVAQDLFVIRHQNALVYVTVFLAVMMLLASLGLLFSQHINIIHVNPSAFDAVIYSAIYVAFHTVLTAVLIACLEVILQEHHSDGYNNF